MDLKICRICGGFDHLKIILDDDSELINKMLICANVNIHPGDQLPKLICAQCDKNLDLCYRLRKQSECTQMRLMAEIQKRQKDQDGTVQKNISITDCITESSGYEQIDLSQFSEDSNEIVMEENCAEESSEAKNIKKQIKKNKIEDFIHGKEENSKLIINQDKFNKQQEVHKNTGDENKRTLEQLSALTEILEPHHLDHKKNNELPCTRSNIFTNASEDSCENMMDKVSEAPISAEYCSIDLLSSSESSTIEWCDNLSNEIDKTLLGDIGELNCYTCNEVFTEKQEYRSHVEQHGQERYQCIQCCKFFPSHFRLKRHEEIHNEVPIHQCPHCNRNYRALYNLKRHIKSVHLGKKSWECNLCNFSFSRVDVLKRHLELHSDEKKYKCSICLQSFKTRDYLYGHHKTHHTSNSDLSKPKKRSKKDNNSKNQCGYCGKMFKSLYTYKNHLLIHTNEKPYSCDSCNKSFRTIAALTTHQRIHDDYRPYQCDLCLKSFRQTAHLKEHKMLHLENVPKYVCNICHAPFAKKSNLKVHLRIHTNEKPFKCADCSAEFSFMHLLQRHASKVHCRSVHKVYTINDLDDAPEEYGGISCIDAFDNEAYHYINTVADDGEIDKNAVNIGNLIENHQNILETSSSELEVIANPHVDQQIIYERNCAGPDCETFANNDKLHSLNFMEPKLSDEYFQEQISNSGNHIKEQKVDIFVTEETKLTSSVYNAYEIE